MKKLIESMDRLTGTADQIPGDQVKGTEKYPFLHQLVGEADSENPFTAIALAKLEKLAYSRRMDPSDVEALRQSITHNINRYGANVETIQRILDMYTNRIRKSGKYGKTNDRDAIEQCLLHALKRQAVPVGEMAKRLKDEYETFLEGYKVVPKLDAERHPTRPGLEGPFRMKSGKVVYYDSKEGKYYDADSDHYMDNNDEQLREGFLRTGRDAVQRQIDHLENKGYTSENDPNLEYVVYYKKDGHPTYRVNYRTSDSKGGEEIRRMSEEQIDEYGSVGTSAPLPQAQPGQPAPPAPGQPAPTANVAVPGQPPVTNNPTSAAPPPAPGQAIPPAPAPGAKPSAPGAVPGQAQVTPEQVAMGFLAGMGNKNPSPAEVTKWARMLGTGMGKIK